MPGKLPEETLVNVLSTLPIDITFIDYMDIIRYYSDYRIFNRTPKILGTTVQNCHKPKSRDEVNRVIEELRSGSIEMSEHPTKKGGKTVRVRYIAVRKGTGKYIGLLETAEWV